MNAVRAFSPILWLLVMAQLSGCASPAQRMDEQAAGFGFRRVVVHGGGYSHVAYIKGGRSATDPALHVYLEGDGTPWIRSRVASNDPTPRKPMMLDLMSLDPAPAVYLGRPCYHGLKSGACTPDMWTNGRYSEAVVASMSAALDRLSAEHKAMALMGFSGGGTLAMLLAERQPKVEAVITISANLDTERWADLHKQPPLAGSLNPAVRPALPQRIRQMHVAGGRDENVPPALVRNAITGQQGAMFKEFPEMDHSCCWRDVWPQILGWLATD